MTTPTTSTLFSNLALKTSEATDELNQALNGVRDGKEITAAEQARIINEAGQKVALGEAVLKAYKGILEAVKRA